ncbi:aromatic ring-hydroxylating dioxygenase subunit alpha [Thermaurantiacus sp.]
MARDEPETRLPPGAARCPGPSALDIIRADSPGAPPALTAESYRFLGDSDISYERYTSPAVFAREMTHLWGRAWQWACREEHLPEAGDWIVYDLGTLSILLVRGGDGIIRAFPNACLHRGTQLKPPGSSGGASELRCPFHGWRWTLEGDLKFVPCRWDFPHVTEDSHALPQLKVGLWGGFVFVNPDPHAPPLETWLSPLAEHLCGRWDLSKRRIALHIQKELPTNWKAAQEAFLEAYHVVETHAQALATAGDANASYDIFSDHVTRFVHTIGTPSPHFEGKLTEQEILERMRIGDATVPEGGTARAVAAARLRRQLGEAWGVDLSPFSDSEMLDSIEYHLFPNMCLFPGVSLPMIYRFRPLGMDPGRTLFDLLFLKLVPEDAPREPPPEPVFVAADQSYASVPGMDPGLGAVYDQDTDNLAAQWRGFHASTKRGQTLGNYQEARIRRFHLTLDEMLARD